MAHSVKPEGTHLRPLVTLVTEYGETTMLSALSRCEIEEGNAELVYSTTHRAKGREWDYVKLDEDFEAAVARSLSPSSAASGQAEFFAEMRLLYVALSRARLAVELPRELLNRLGLNATAGAVLGSDRGSKTHVSVTAKAASGPPSVSPYHAPQPGESAEIAAVRRFFR
jgi:ATP-dependent exoDNAse (exonuclease V) beta subunit